MIARLAVIAVLLLAACSSPGSPGESTGGSTESTGPGAGTGGGGLPSNLCDAVSEELAVAALGGDVAEPSFGDVLPRPAGIYCHYALAADANFNVETQLNEMTREDLEALAARLLMDQPLSGVGEVAFQRASSIMGLAGVSVAAWADGRGVTVSINASDGADAAALLDAASAIAEAALAS
ncbi:MAG: hypothetical protein WD116_03935 [Chloroflexota bacterium]